MNTAAVRAVLANCPQSLYRRLLWLQVRPGTACAACHDTRTIMFRAPLRANLNLIRCAALFSVHPRATTTAGEWLFPHKILPLYLPHPDALPEPPLPQATTRAAYSVSFCFHPPAHQMTDGLARARARWMHYASTRRGAPWAAVEEVNLKARATAI